MHTDPIADMLTRIRNACHGRKARVDIPLSTIKLGLAEVLKREGFIEDFREVKGAKAYEGVLEIKLRYDEQNEP
jgi:small subunit ribosomal protein S8